jgi:hypothetical protein
MRITGCLVVLSLLSVSSRSHTLSDINQGYRFDASVYGAIETIGKNVYAQTDLSIGYSISHFGMLSFETNLKYRNYCLVTTEYLSVCAGAMIGKNEGRLGIFGGCRTFLFSGFGTVTPLAGWELLYSRYINEHISFRIKERIAVMISPGKTLLTDSFFGFGISF